jgi:quinohemoprotein ethanol dehydrogenase
VALGNAALWKSIVLDGALEPNGMIGWSAFIDAIDAENIRAYIAAQARALQAAEAGQSPPSPALQIDPAIAL